ncbi:MAG: PQQ-dependent sugar dehydrogenase [Gammaproteobacteria bacterium]|nr:PQQ-dependent sugar dehydrogenase [Gammaproteobacteria bacterium]
MSRIIQWLFIAIVSVMSASLEAELQYQTTWLQLGSEQQVVNLPKGFQLELLTDQLQGPRMLSFSSAGELLIGSRSGAVYRLKPPYRQPETLIELDDYPHSVAIRGNYILIAQTGGLYQAVYRAGQASIEPGTLALFAKIPGGGGHNSRTLAIGPDGRIYLSLGISGNCSNQYLDNQYPFNQRRGGVWVLDESRQPPVWQTYASGLRNPVGFDWHPQTGVMYASNNGPDHWGFELPPEYFSQLVPGSFHGMPWYQYDGRELKRDDCIDARPPKKMNQVSLPVATFPARNAPMGVAFVASSRLGKELENAAIVALRGSWATRPRGNSLGDPASRRPPKIVWVDLSTNPARVHDLITGFQQENGQRWARPVGVAIGPDGALYFTSDSGINGLFKLSKIQ